MSEKIAGDGLVQKQGDSVEDIPSNEVLLARAKATQESFWQDVNAMIAAIPEKPDGRSPFNLETMRESVRDRGYTPGF